MVDGDTRKYAAVLGRRYCDGSVTAEALFEHFGDMEDPLIVELLRTVANEPRRGFWGVREREWQKSFQLPVMKLLAELEKGEEGSVPVVAVADVSPWAIFGLAIFILWAGASAAEHAWKLWQGSIPWWRGAIHALWSALLMLFAVGGAITLRDRLAQYRTQRANRRGSDR